MDTDHISTYKEATHSVDDSAKENPNPRKSSKKRKRHDDEITNPFFRPFAVAVCICDASKPALPH